MQKINNLQILRAIAAILVVWAHAIDLVSKRNLSSWQTDFLFLENFGAVGVDLFFVISGFIVTISAKKYQSTLYFIFNRLYRIYPIYILATLLIFFTSPDSIIKTEKLFWSLIFLQMPGQAQSFPTHPLGWSLFFEIYFYALLAISILWKTKREFYEKITILLVAFILLGSLMNHLWPMNIIGNPINMEFLFGILIGSIYSSSYKIPRWLSFSSFFLGVILFAKTIVDDFGALSEAELIMDASLSWERVRIWGLPSALIVFSAVTRPLRDIKKRNFFEFLGDASYSIYLFSFAALLVIDKNWHLFSQFSPDTIIIGSTIISIAFGVIVYLAVEAPLKTFGKRLKNQSIN